VVKFKTNPTCLADLSRRSTAKTDLSRRSFSVGGSLGAVGSSSKESSQLNIDGAFLVSFRIRPFLTALPALRSFSEVGWMKAKLCDKACFTRKICRVHVVAKTSVSSVVSVAEKIRVHSWQIFLYFSPKYDIIPTSSSADERHSPSRARFQVQSTTSKNQLAN